MSNRFASVTGLLCCALVFASAASAQQNSGFIEKYPQLTPQKDRPKVLAQAVRLGRLARKLAQDEKRVEITRQIAKRASKTIALDKRCNSILPPGSGKYCPPSGV